MNCPLFYFWKVLLWRNTLIFLLLVVAPAWARSVDYEHRTLSRVLVHVVTVNLNDPQVKVTPFVAAGFPGTDEDFAALIARAQPTAAINGTFFGKQDLKPTGDIVIDGKLVNFGGMGTALAIDADNRVTFRRVPYGRHVDWAAKGYVSVLACGPSLILAGQVGVDPELEGFSDPHVLEAGPRSAVGITAYNKLKLVCVPAGVTLSRLASIMEQLGCVSAMNLDGGASTALYYRGKTIVAPGRRLTNLLVVYENRATAPTPSPTPPPSSPEPSPPPEPTLPPPTDVYTPPPEPTPPLEPTPEPSPSFGPADVPPVVPSTGLPFPPAPPPVVPELAPVLPRTLSPYERGVLYAAAGLTLLSLLQLTLATRRHGLRPKGFNRLFRALHLWWLAGLVAVFGWLGLWHYLFRTSWPEEPLLMVAFAFGVGLWPSLLTFLLRTGNSTDGGGYGLFAGLLLAGGGWYVRGQPWAQPYLNLYPLAEWAVWKTFVLYGFVGLLSGAVTGHFLGRMRKMWTE